MRGEHSGLKTTAPALSSVQTRTTHPVSLSATTVVAPVSGFSTFFSTSLKRQTGYLLNSAESLENSETRTVFPLKIGGASPLVSEPNG